MKHIYILVFIALFSIASTLSDIKIQTLKNNVNLQIIKDDIKISAQDELLSTKWKNMILGFGINDIQLNDIGSRDIEAMQTQYITISQIIPMGNKLGYKSDILKTKQEISTLLLEDKKAKYNSLIISNLNEYTIIKRKISFISKLQTNLKRIEKLQMQKFKLTNIGQIAILNTNTNYLQTKIVKQNLINKLAILKINIENISYSNHNSFEYILSEYILEENINIKNLLQSNNMYKALEKGIIKSKQYISLQKATYTSDLKLNFGYYQRKNFEDYVSLSLAYPLSIYGSEDIKVKKSKIEFKKQEAILRQFKNEFKIKIKLLLQEMKIAYMNYGQLKHNIIDKQKKISKILHSQGINNKINTIKQLENTNKIYNNELKALTQLSKFYNAKAKLSYYKGESL